jgi:hypothetical protein
VKAGKHASRPAAVTPAAKGGKTMDANADTAAPAKDLGEELQHLHDTVAMFERSLGALIESADAIEWSRDNHYLVALVAIAGGSPTSSAACT